MTALAAVEQPALTNIETEAGLLSALMCIGDPSAAKIIIMSKWERGEITSFAAERLIQHLDLSSA